MPATIQYSGEHVDLSPRFASTTTVVGSPAAAAETIVAQLPQLGDLSKAAGVELIGWCAYTVGTSGVSGRLRIRQTNVAGAVVADSGALTVAATNLVAPAIEGIDTAAVLPGQVYVLTLQVGSGAAASTVSAVYLRALVV